MVRVKPHERQRLERCVSVFFFSEIQDLHAVEASSSFASSHHVAVLYPRRRNASEEPSSSVFSPMAANISSFASPNA